MAVHTPPSAKSWGRVVSLKLCGTLMEKVLIREVEISATSARITYLIQIVAGSARARGAGVRRLRAISPLTLGEAGVSWSRHRLSPHHRSNGLCLRRSA